MEPLNAVTVPPVQGVRDGVKTKRRTRCIVIDDPSSDEEGMFIYIVRIGGTIS